MRGLALGELFNGESPHVARAVLYIPSLTARLLAHLGVKAA
jgi:hypothetical protein